MVIIMKVLLAHPGKQHSFETATALKKSGLLYKYITSIYDKDGSITSKAKRLLPFKMQKKAMGRHCIALDNNDVVQFDELKFLMVLMLSKFPHTEALCRFLNDRFSDSFGRKVAELAIRENVDAVICYDSNCKVLFDILSKKAPHIRRIMDVSTANRIYMVHEFDKYINETGEAHIKQEQSFLWKKSNCKRYISEIQNTEYFIVASQFVKKSLLYSGVKEKQISVIPYGVDPKKFSYRKKTKYKEKLQLLYVGQITCKKGLEYLLKAVSTFPTEKVSITLAGDFNKTNPIYRKYKDKDNIQFLGFVTRDVLANVYREADVFVFPTLGEGFGMVILEAMSCGLPAIVSDHAGGNDVILDGFNGFEFEAGNEKMLSSQIEWFILHPERIPEMSENAYETALNYTWDRYHTNVSRVIEKMCNEQLAD